jgi:hypothetical protein
MRHLRFYRSPVKGPNRLSQTAGAPCLFVFAGIATLLGHPAAVSATTQLILGNYTNASSSAGAGIAAGASLTSQQFPS